MASSVDIDEIERWLRAVFAAAPRDAMVEVRFRRSAGMGQSFHRVHELSEAVTAVAAHARQRDVFAGVVPRRRRGGRRQDLVREAPLLWADCDGPESVDALRRFEPAPSMIVVTGTGSNCHSYWFLTRPEPLDVLERANRRLALALHADLRSGDAARILRPGGTTNRKAEPCQSVGLAHLDLESRVDLDDVRQGLPELAEQPRGHHEYRTHTRSAGTDALLQITPQEYVEHLSGRQVRRDGKINCPFHDDASPSLHVFDEPARGWFCFGCGRGGSIYDFAGLLWGRGLRGADFLRLRQELRETFLGEHERPPLREGPGDAVSRSRGVAERSVF